VFEASAKHGLTPLFYGALYHCIPLHPTMSHTIVKRVGPVKRNMQVRCSFQRSVFSRLLDKCGRAGSGPGDHPKAGSCDAESFGCVAESRRLIVKGWLAGRTTVREAKA
jgi:hypothetical protein